MVAKGWRDGPAGRGPGALTEDLGSVPDVYTVIH